MFSIKDLDVALADIKNTNVTYMAIKDLLFWPTWGSQAPRLPVAYQEVEYIQANWSQYIDTWYAPNNNTKIYAKFAHWATQNQWPLFWARWRSWYTEYNYQYILWSHCSEYNQWGTAMDNKPCPLFCHEYNTSSTSWWIKFLDTRYPAWTVIEFEYDKNWWYYWPDNTWTWSPATNTASINMLIFGLREWTTIDSRKFDWKLFAFKVWESWVAKRDFVPCYRKEDGEIWLYDLVTNEFYTNAWSWSFTMWWDKRKSVLPRWYSEIQYIQSTATNPWTVTSSWQYIDTLYTPNQYTKIAIDMQFQNLTRQSRLFAIHDTNTSYMTMAAYINWSDKWARAMKNWEWDWLSTEVAVDTGRHTFTLKNWNYKIQTGNTVNYNSSNATSSSTSARHTLPLLAAWDFAENKIVDHASARIYGCTIFEKEVMVRNFMPCVSKYWEVWLYDFVEWKFYPNAWTWEFATWPRVYYEDSVNIPKDWLLWYWPLSSDLKDYSWNKNDWRWYSWTGSFAKNAGKDWARVTTNNPVSTQHIITTLDYEQIPITIGWWVCYNAMDSNAWHGLMSSSNGSGKWNTIWSRPADNNYPNASVASSTPVRIDSVVPSTNKWYFWMATNDGTTLKTYQNWVLTNSWPVTSFIAWWVRKLWCAMVDGWQTVNSWTNWWVRHCFVYNRVLDWDEAMEVYKKTSCSERWKSDLVFCDYIESTGTQWIDTGLTWAQADDVEMEFSFPSQPSAVAVPMWVRWDNSAADSVIRINESNIIEPRFWNWISTGVEMFAKTKYKVRTEFKSWAQKVYVNDVQKATWSLTYTYNASRTYYLFAFHDASVISCKCSCRMYNCKIKLWDTVVRNFVPCFVKYTGEAGMWDTVNEKFYPNIWTWSFWKWFNKFSPEDYQKVEYIGSARSWSWTYTWQFIRTLFKANQDTSIEMKINATSVVDNACLYCSRDINAGTKLYAAFRIANVLRHDYLSSQKDTGYSISANTIYTIKSEKNKMYVNWNLIDTITAWTFKATYAMILLASNAWWDSTNIDNYFTGRLYWCKIRDNETLVRDFIPCYRIRDWVIWLYDTVNDYFYTNSGSGNFTKGRNVYEKKDLAFCDYIRSTWTQYIKTDIVPSNTKWVYMRLSSQDTTSDLLFIWSRKTSDTRFWIWNSNWDNAKRVYLWWNTNDRWVISQNTIFEVKLNYLNDRKKQVDGSVIASNIWALSSSNDVPIYIFAWNDNYSTDPSLYAPSKIKLYSCKVSDWSNIIADFKPCYIKKTWEAWLWDEVEQKFYGNDWTWAFYRWNEWWLPSLYRQVTFIKSNAAWQHIDTWVTTNGADNTEMEWEVAFYTDTSYDTAFWKKWRIRFFFWVLWSNSWAPSYRWCFRWWWNDKYWYTSLVNDYRKHTFKISTSSPVLYIDWVAYNVNTQSSTSSTSSAKIWIFWAQYASWSTVNWEDAALSAVYSFKIRRNWELIRDFVPCYRKTDWVIWLYDLVTWWFYINGGSWTLDKWDDV